MPPRLLPFAPQVRKRDGSTLDAQVSRLVQQLDSPVTSSLSKVSGGRAVLWAQPPALAQASEKAASFAEITGPASSVGPVARTMHPQTPAHAHALTHTHTRVHARTRTHR